MVFATRSRKYNDIKSNNKYKNRRKQKTKTEIKTKKTEIKTIIKTVNKTINRIINETCPICYEDIEKKNYIITDCNHIFCNNCLFKSLNKQSCCPICRKEIFNFDKVKNLEDEDVINLENIISNFKKHLILKTIYELKKAINFSLNANNCDCLTKKMLNIVIEQFNCVELNQLLINKFSEILNKAFTILSLTSYENLHNWLKM